MGSVTWDRMLTAGWIFFLARAVPSGKSFLWVPPDTEIRLTSVFPPSLVTLILISLTMLLDLGLLKLDDLSFRPDLSARAVDYPAVMEWKQKLLQIAFKHFQKTRRRALREEYENSVEDHAFWLKDFGLFMAIKSFFGWNLLAGLAERVSIAGNPHF